MRAQAMRVLAPELVFGFGTGALDEPYAEVIVLYRVDRGCLAGLLDRPHQDALK